MSSRFLVRLDKLGILFCRICYPPLCVFFAMILAMFMAAAIHFVWSGDQSGIFDSIPIAVAVIILMPIPIVWLLRFGWNCATGNAFKEDADYKPDRLERTVGGPLALVGDALGRFIGGLAELVGVVIVGIARLLGGLVVIGLVLLILLGIAGLLWFGIKQLF
jgi:hypothetical protein